MAELEHCPTVTDDGSPESHLRNWRLGGAKGDIPAPAMRDQGASVMTIARKEHSAKPEQFLELIEQYFPSLPKIELNRRGAPRAGWDAWGYEVLAA